MIRLWPLVQALTADLTSLYPSSTPTNRRVWAITYQASTLSRECFAIENSHDLQEAFRIRGDDVSGEYLLKISAIGSEAPITSRLR